jgi:hypothetical protein
VGIVGSRALVPVLALVLAGTGCSREPAAEPVPAAVAGSIEGVPSPAEEPGGGGHTHGPVELVGPVCPVDPVCPVIPLVPVGPVSLCTVNDALVAVPIPPAALIALSVTAAGPSGMALVLIVSV